MKIRMQVIHFLSFLLLIISSLTLMNFFVKSLFETKSAVKLVIVSPGLQNISINDIYKLKKDFESKGNFYIEGKGICFVKREEIPSTKINNDKCGIILVIR